MTKPRRTTEEQQLLKRAAQVLPGGSLGNHRLDDEYAFIVKEGRGSRIWDASGNEYIDYLLGSGPAVLGHAHPAVVSAVEEALRKGSTFFTQNEYAIALAGEIIDAVPCAEKVRFTTSGTDATFQCLRLARAYRKRDKVMKFEGGYHGTHDYAVMSVAPVNPPEFPLPQANSAGVPKAVQDTVLVAPFNDLEKTTEIIRAHHDDLAAVIMEPLQRVLAPLPGFLQGVRQLTTEYEIPLIFDEVVTGFRLAYGGAQEYYGVTPDLAALGKIVGGGFPLGAVVGRQDLLDAYDQEAAGEFHVGQVGTLNGNPVAAAAGLATLAQLRQEGRYERYHATGRHLRETLQRFLNEAEIPAVVSGADIMFDVYFTDQPVTGYRSTLSANKGMNKTFDRTMLENGVLKPPGKMYVGMCHDERDVGATIDAFKAAVESVRG
jgi:glutamate-1-semialdehyde 2,1-aminomutase